MKLEKPSPRQSFPSSQIALILILVLLAVLFLIWPVWRAFLPLQIDHNEGWNAYLADAAFGVGPLYPAPSELIGNNYPPLYPLLIGAFAELFGDAVYVGRALSLLATLGLAVTAAAIVRQFGGGRTAAILAGSWFAATMARFYDLYVGMNDPQLFAHLIMAVALLLFISSNKNKRPVESAILLMVLAGFVKHNIVAIPVSALVWLALDDWHKAPRAALVGIAAAVSGLLICTWIFRPYFVSDMLAPRAYHVDRALLFIRATHLWLPALLLWALWAWSERDSKVGRFTTIFIGVSLVSFVAQRSAEGVGYSAQFELVFAIAIGLGLAFERLPLYVGPIGRSAVPIRLVVLAVVLLRLIASTRMEFAYVVFSPEYRGLATDYSAITRAEATRLAAIPNPIGCWNLVVCRMAGKAFVFDDFKVSQMIATGMYSRQDIDSLIRARGISFESVDPRTYAFTLARRDWLIPEMADFPLPSVPSGER